MKEAKVSEIKNLLSRYLALVKKGMVRRGSGKIPREILSQDPPGEPVGALEALLEERRQR